MSPRSLVFSSNQEISRKIIQALQELELDVEYCPEIFGAIERLTGHSFDVVAADWDDGAEASFLLKTTRELKLNKSAFTVALANGAAKMVAEASGVDLVLSKPVAIDQVKYGLLTNDNFLSRMKVWVANDSPETLGRTFPGPADVRKQTVPPQLFSQVERVARAAEPSPQFEDEFDRLTEPINPPEPVNLTFATLERGFFGFGRRKTLPIIATARRNAHKFLWGSVIVVAFCSFGYVFGQPLGVQKVLASVNSVYESALKVKLIRRHAPKDASVADPVMAAQKSGAEPRRNSMLSTRFQASLARRSPLANQMVIAQLGAPSANPAAQDPQNQPLSAAPPNPRIPESLKFPPTIAEAVRAVDAKLNPSSLFGQMEPVNLPEDLSTQLLTQKVQPSYPEQAVRAGLQGAVVLQAWIARDGTIRDLKLVRGSFLLGQAAYQAVKQWRYKPYLRNGEAVEAQTFVTVNFRLPQQSLLTPYPR